MSLGIRMFARMILAAAVLVACGGGGEASEGGGAGEATPRDPDAPGLHRIGPNRYQAVIYAYEGGFDPAEIRVPAGADVTFRTRSLDIPHGFFVQGPNLKLITLAGEFSTVTHTFTTRGEHTFFCDEYCGGGHEAMRGRIVVE